MTGNVPYQRHFYEVEKVLKVYTIYKLVDAVNRKVLTDLIRIEDFRKYSNGKGFDKYFRLRNVNNWSKCEKVTGLKFTDNKNLFYGDRLHAGRRNLIVFHFNDNRSRLTIDYYVGYYPNKEVLKQLLEKYN